MPCKYCLSLFPRSEEDIWMNQPLFTQVDAIEIRLDDVGDKLDLKKLTRVLNIPIIVTIRSRQEGGEWNRSLSEKIHVYQKAIQAGINYLDIEWQESGEVIPQLPLTPQHQIILSHHTTTNELDQLIHNFSEMLLIPADIFKFVYTARNLNDNLTALRLIEMARDKGVRYVIHAMGREGQLSRILGALQGNEFTYVSPSPQTPTAPGQLSLQAARNVFFLHQKSSATPLIGLLGYPVEQSSSWKLHNRLLQRKRAHNAEETGDFIYLNFPARDLDDFWKNWEPLINGLSITLPHKKDIVSKLDFLSQSVEKSTVCNTAIKRNGKWWGFNTDFMAICELLQAYSDLLWEGVFVYGAGATSRSVITALKELGIQQIFLASRDEEKGSSLAEEFHVRFVPESEWTKWPFRTIIHTTPLGMFPATQEMPPLEPLLPHVKLVFDVVYNPAYTLLLQRAQKYGCQVISGEEMYVRQACHQFEIFSGMAVDLNEVKEVWEAIKSESLTL